MLIGPGVFSLYDTMLHSVFNYFGIHCFSFVFLMGNNWSFILNQLALSRFTSNFLACVWLSLSFSLLFLWFGLVNQCTTKLGRCVGSWGGHKSRLWKRRLPIYSLFLCSFSPSHFQKPFLSNYLERYIRPALHARISRIMHIVERWSKDECTTYLRRILAKPNSTKQLAAICMLVLIIMQYHICII